MTSDTRRKVVLVVEDDVDVRDLLVDVLEGEYTVWTAANGDEALKRINKEDVFSQYARNERHLPNCILLDIMMPVMDGLQFYATILHFGGEELHKIAKDHTIILTAYPDSAEKTLPWVMCIRKPIDPALLVEAVRRKIS